jgi:hypothetical protein
MNWRPWRFRKSPEEQAAREIFATAEARSRVVMQPISALANGIVAASWQSCQAIKPYMRKVEAEFIKRPVMQEIYIFREFMYFFVYLMTRQARAQMPQKKADEFKKTILECIVRPAAVDAFFDHWPEDLKSRIERDTYQKLAETEAEYDEFMNAMRAEAKNRWEDTELRAELDLRFRLAMNILPLAGYEAEVNNRVGTEPPPVLMAVGHQVGDTLSSGSLKNLGELVKQASAAIDFHERTYGNSLRQMFRDYREWAEKRKQ